jgi:hypothetical protein
MGTENSSKLTDSTVERDCLTLSTAHKESHSKDSSATFPRLNPEVNAVPVPYPPESSNAKASSERSKTSGYPFWPWPSPTPALNIPILPGSESDPALTSDDNNNNNKNKKKEVRINEYTEVKEISELGLDNTKEKSYEIINLDPKIKPHRNRGDEKDKNTTSNSEPSNSNTLNYFKGKQKSSKLD